MKKPDVNGNGSLFQRFPEVLRNKLGTKCLAMQNHSFRTDARLDSFFKILATSTDKNGKPYGSSTQISGACCSVLSRGIPHLEDAVHVTQHVANFFVREARISAKNKPKPSPR